MGYFYGKRENLPKTSAKNVNFFKKAYIISRYLGGIDSLVR